MTPTEKKYKEMDYAFDGEVVVKHGTSTPLYPKKSKKPVQAIRFFCLECMGWDRQQKDGQKPNDDVRECTDPMCPLFDFRIGKNVFHSKLKGDTEALQKARRIQQNKGKSAQNRTISLMVID